MIWTDGHSEKLGELIDRGLSASQCAKMLGATRNAVLGRAWREGWVFGRPRTPEERSGVNARRYQRRVRNREGRVEKKQFSVNFDPDTITEIDAWARTESVSRCEAVRVLVEWGLMAAEDRR